MLLAFDPYKGETGFLYTSDKHLNFKWNNPNCNIIFSMTRQGNAVVGHFISDKAGLRKLEQALNEWCEFCFLLFDWCEMVIGIITKPSVVRLAEKCGFKYVASFGNKKVYVRRQK